MEMATRVKTETETQRYAMKLFTVQWTEPNVQFLGRERGEKGW